MKNPCCNSKLHFFFCSLLCMLAVQPISAQSVPTITGISPVAANANSSIIISGTNFSATLSDNVVWFGGVKAPVTAASATQLTVTVPLGAGNPLRVFSSNLVAQSPVSFILTFPSLASLSASSFTTFTPAQGMAIQNGSYNGLSLNSFGNLKFADLDGDAKPDMVMGRIGVYTQFNTSTPGTISAGTINGATVVGASFEARNNGGNIQGLLSELTSYQTNAAQEGDLDIGDIDGDGRQDIVSCVYRPANGDRVSVFRNITSAAGSLTSSNFASPVTYSTGGRWARRVRLADFDNDGKLDVLISTSSGGGAVLRNTSTPGSISFASIVNLSAGIVEDFIEVMDMDGDGKTDIVTRAYSGSQAKVLRNTSSGSGSISFAAAQAFTIESGGTAFKMADVDGDGKTDILASGNAGKMYILRNSSSSGSISFAAYYTINTSSSFNIYDVAMGDLDGDSKVDIAFNDGGYIVYVVKNNSSSGSLSFGTYAALNPSGGLTQYASEVVIQDVDGDGRNDIASLSTYANGIHYFTNSTSMVVLPVSWLGFSAQLKPNGVQLQWATAAEQQNGYFDIERSTDEGKKFQTIGRVAGALNSSVTHTYNWLDASPVPTIAWYRIKQTDIDQKASYSKIIQVSNNKNIRAWISPNPTPDCLQLHLPVEWTGNYDLRIVDQQGRTRLHRRVSGSNPIIDCSAWSNGLYRLMLYSGKETVLSETFLKQ